MLKVITSSAELPAFPDDPCGVRIAAIASAYGFDYSFALFWRQLCEETGRVTALVASFDRNLTICATEDADFAELAAFIGAIGGESLLCAASVGQRLGLSGGQACTALRFVGSDLPCAQIGEISYMALYALLQSGTDGGIKLPGFESWYVDLSHRVRHNAARTLAVMQSGTPVAAAIAAYETDEAALLSGVATLPPFRASGYGKAAVCTLSNTLHTQGKAVFVLARAQEVGFYVRCGFTPIEKMIEYQFSEE